MARKTAVVTITDEGRDRGKVFVLKEAPAAQAERWATRALLALARSGVEMPANAEGAGWAGIAYLGFQALSKLSFDEVQPLLDEMWQCVTLQPDPKHPEITRPLYWGGPDGEGSDIDEIATMVKLRAEVFALHSGFSLPGVLSTSPTSTTTSTSGESPSTTTSAPSMATPSPRRSPPGRRLSGSSTSGIPSRTST